jgi:hypothetical protein
MRDRREAEFRNECEMAKVLADRNWREGLIGDATYLRSLMLIGFGDRDAHTELSLLRRQVWRLDDHETRRLGASRAWLKEREMHK